MSLHRSAAPATLAALLAVASVQAAAAADTSAASPGTPAPPVVPTPSLAESLGLQPGAQPVRERPGWHPPHVILIADRFADRLPQLQTAVPPDVRLVLVGKATPRQLADADAAVGVCTSELLAKATRVQWIQWPSAGVENCVRQSAVRERHILLTNMQRVFGPSIAEHVIALMLALSRHLDFYYREQQQAHWNDGDDVPEAVDLQGKTVLVAGLGGLGTEVARRAHALGMRVIATRASGRTGPEFVSYVGLPDELMKLTREADYVVNCLPLTAQTRGLFNAQFFAAMKPSAYFLSVGRGGSTVTADLIAALNGHRIAGAGLDVVDPEPLPADSPLWHAPHVLLTPHVSANSPLSEEQRTALLRENLRRYSAGEALFNVVDVERGY